MAKAEFQIDQDTLNALRNEGIVSEFLEARLQFIESFHLRNQHIRPLGRCVNCGFYPGEKPKLECDNYQPMARCYPNMMGPQSSGRMSVSAPPLINFTADKKYGPDGVRDVVVPDPGEKWVACDWEAIEARFISHRSGDSGDNEAFRKAWDIHTVTAQRMFKWPEFTFDPLKKNIYGAPGQEWCAHVGWLIHQQTCHLKDHTGCKVEPFHDDHRYRRLAKNCRYCLQYAFDEKAMARYAVEMKMPKEQLWAFGKLYLASKPILVAWKRRTWAECWRTHEARTFMGRRRRLGGAKKDVMKEGLNHIIQGSVADMMKTTLRLVLAAYPLARLAYQSHDGFKFVFPRNVVVGSRIREIVEREVIAWGKPISFPAAFKVIFPPEQPGEEKI